MEWRFIVEKTLLLKNVLGFLKRTDNMERCNIEKMKNLHTAH